MIDGGWDMRRSGRCKEKNWWSLKSWDDIVGWTCWWNWLVIAEGEVNGREDGDRAASAGFEAGIEEFSSAPPTFILLLPLPALLLLVPSLDATLVLPLSTLALPEGTTGLGGLAELKYRLPPGLDEKKDEYALQFAGGGLKRRGRKDIKSSF
jgi:hypothetical protein